MSTVEMVTFRTGEAVTDEAFLKASEAIGEWAKQQPGFEYRALAKKENGEWLDTVYWADHQSAMNAAEAFPKAMGDAEFMAMIKPDSVSVEHAAVLSQLAGM